MSRILIVRIGGMGDIVMASALLSRIRRERPGAHVTWASGTRFADLVRLLGVDEVVTVEDKDMQKDHHARLIPTLGPVMTRMGAKPFDEVLAVYPDPGYRALVIAGLGKAHSPANMPPGRGMMPGRYWADQFAGLLGVDPTGPIERLDDVVDVRRNLDAAAFAPASAPRVVIVPGAGRQMSPNGPVRRWPAERYGELAKRLTGAGLRVALIGDADDVWVRPQFAGIPVDDHLGTLPIRDTLRLIRDSAVMVSHDTGPMHLSRLVGTPLIALFGPTVPAQHLPETDGVFWGGAHLACRPCWGSMDTRTCRTNLCMQDIAVDGVFARVLELTQSRSER